MKLERWAAKIVAGSKTVVLACSVVGTVLFLGCRDHAGSVATSQQAAPRHSKLEIPETWAHGADSVLPISYLKELRVDPEMSLTEVEKQQLSRLIARAHQDSIKLYHQSYFLPSDTPLGRVIKKNYPAAPRREGGQLYYLGDLATYLDSAAAR